MGSKEEVSLIKQMIFSIGHMSELIISKIYVVEAVVIIDGQ